MEVESEEWLEQAVADWNTAKHNLEFDDFYASVLFSQQSAEKALSQSAKISCNLFHFSLSWCGAGNSRAVL